MVRFGLLVLSAEKGFVLKQFLSGQQPVMTASSGSVSQKAVDLLDWLDPIDSMGNGNVLNVSSDRSYTLGSYSS